VDDTRAFTRQTAALTLDRGELQRTLHGIVAAVEDRGTTADQRVFELLDEKLHLFDGVFGASDGVLGALESGVDIERRIAEVYQTCRTTAEITAAFDALQAMLDEAKKTTLKDVLPVARTAAMVAGGFALLAYGNVLSIMAVGWWFYKRRQQQQAAAA
jgi:hypothetical protein